MELVCICITPMMVWHHWGGLTLTVLVLLLAACLLGVPLLRDMGVDGVKEKRKGDTSLEPSGGSCSCPIACYCCAAPCKAAIHQKVYAHAM